MTRNFKSKFKKPPKPLSNAKDRYLSDLADDLARLFGTKVQIKRRGQKGKVEIEFYSDDDLDRLLTLLNQSR